MEVHMKKIAAFLFLGVSLMVLGQGGLQAAESARLPSCADVCGTIPQQTFCAIYNAGPWEEMCSSVQGDVTCAYYWCQILM